MLPSRSWFQIYLSSRFFSKNSSQVTNSIPLLEEIKKSSDFLSISTNISVVHCLILSDSFLWKEVRSILKTFLMNSMLKFYYFKLNLGICFTECYPIILKLFLTQDIEAEYSIIFFSVQLYTVPSIVFALLKSHNLFVTILNCTINGFREAYIDSTFTFTSPFIKNRRYFHPFQDLRYLIDGSNYEDLENHQKSEIIKLLLVFFNLFSGMNVNSHSTKEHVEYETDSWIHAFNISLQCAKFAQELQKYFVTSFETGCQVLSLIIQEASDVLSFSSSSQDTVAVPPVGGQFSFHQPVQWFISNILRSTRKFSDKFPSELRSKLSLFLPNVVIPCIQLQVYLGQIRSNLWVRNGYALRNQVYNYLGVNLIDEMRDLDLYLIQEFLQLCPNAVEVIINCFHFEAYLFPEASLSGSITADALVNARLGQLDHFLSLFINLISPDIAEQFSAIEMVRRSLIHFLFLAPSSNSELLKKLPGKFSENPDVKDVLLSISIQRSKRCSIGDKMIFQLKPELVIEVDIFYTYFSYIERQSCFDMLVQDKALSTSPLFPQNLSFNADSLNYVMHSSLFFGIIFTCLSTLRDENDGIFILLQILYIIHSGFHFMQSKQNISSCQDFISSLTMLREVDPREGFPVSIYSLLKSLLSIGQYACIQSTLKVVLSEIESFQGGNIVGDGMLLDFVSRKKEQALERKRMILEKMQKAQNLFVQKCEFLEAEEIPPEPSFTTSTNSPDDSFSSDSYFVHDNTDEETVSDGVDLWNEDRSDIIAMEEISDAHVSFSPSSIGDMDKYIDPFNFLQKTECEKVKYQLLNKQRQAYSFNLKGTVNVEQQNFPKNLGTCNICHELLCPTDTSKVLGIIARLLKKRFMREYSEKHIRGFAIEQPNDLLFLFSEQKFDSWTSNKFSSVFLSCRHLFHYSCLKTLTNGKQFRCPLCRKRGNIFLPYFDRSSTTPIPYKQRQLGTFPEHQNLPLFKNGIFLSSDDFDSIEFPFFMASIQSICDRWNYYYGKYYLFHANPNSLPAMIDHEGLSLIQQYMAKCLFFDVKEGHLNLLFIEHTCDMLCNIVATIEISLRKDDLSRSELSNQAERSSNITSEFLHQFTSVIEMYKIFITASTLISSSNNSSKYESLKESMAKAVRIFTTCDQNSSFIKDLIIYSVLFYSPDSMEDFQKFRCLVAFLFVKYYVLQYPSLNTLIHVSNSSKYMFFLIYLRLALIFESLFFGVEKEPDRLFSTSEEFSFLYTNIYRIDFFWISLNSFFDSFDNANCVTFLFRINNSEIVIDLKKYFTPISFDSTLTTPSLPYPFRYSFIALPLKFDQLVIQSAKRICGHCGTIPSETAICLVCGKLCCFKSTCCFLFKQMGECNFHMIE